MLGIGLRRGNLVRHRWAYIVVFGLFQRGRVALPRNIEFFSNFNLVFIKLKSNLSNKFFLNFGDFVIFLHRFKNILAINYKKSSMLL